MLDLLFVVSAIVGGGIFTLRMILTLIGIGDDHDIGSEASGGAAHSDSDVGMQLLSIQGITSFLMMFGLVGLALTREAGLEPVLSVPIALAAGVAAMWTVAKVYSWMLGLQSSGTLDLAQAIGQQGIVYLTIKPGTGGQVQVAVQGRLGIYEAQPSGGAEIATGRAVRVVGVQAGQLLVEALPVN